MKKLDKTRTVLPMGLVEWQVREIRTAYNARKARAQELSQAQLRVTQAETRLAEICANHGVAIQDAWHVISALENAHDAAGKTMRLQQEKRKRRRR